MSRHTLFLMFVLAVTAVRPVPIFVELNEHLQSSYEAVAHLLVGGLFGAYFVSRKFLDKHGGSYGDAVNLLWMAMGMTAVEIVCAVISVAYGVLK